jgi:hypothetical protein
VTLRARWVAGGGGAFVAVPLMDVPPAAAVHSVSRKGCENIWHVRWAGWR